MPTQSENSQNPNAILFFAYAFMVWQTIPGKPAVSRGTSRRSRVELTYKRELEPTPPSSPVFPTSEAPPNLPSETQAFAVALPSPAIETQALFSEHSSFPVARAVNDSPANRVLADIRTRPKLKRVSAENRVLDDNYSMIDRGHQEIPAPEELSTFFSHWGEGKPIREALRLQKTSPIGNMAGQANAITSLPCTHAGANRVARAASIDARVEAVGNDAMRLRMFF